LGGAAAHRCDKGLSSVLALAVEGDCRAERRVFQHSEAGLGRGTDGGGHCPSVPRRCWV